MHKGGSGDEGKEFWGRLSRRWNSWPKHSRAFCCNFAYLHHVYLHHAYFFPNDFPAKNTIHTPCVHGSDQPYLYVQGLSMQCAHGIPSKESPFIRPHCIWCVYTILANLRHLSEKSWTPNFHNTRVHTILANLRHLSEKSWTPNFHNTRVHTILANLRHLSEKSWTPNFHTTRVHTILANLKTFEWEIMNSKFPYHEGPHWDEEGRGCGDDDEVGDAAMSRSKNTQNIERASWTKNERQHAGEAAMDRSKHTNYRTKI